MAVEWGDKGAHLLLLLNADRRGPSSVCCRHHRSVYVPVCRGAHAPILSVRAASESVYHRIYARMSPYDIGIARFASRYTNNVSEIGRFYWKAMKNSCSSCTDVPDYRVTMDVNSLESAL